VVLVADRMADLERQIDVLESTVRERGRDVIRAEPAVRRMVSDYVSALRTTVNLRAALDFVAVNDMVVSRSSWATRQLVEKDRVLVIQATQGG